MAITYHFWSLCLILVEDSLADPAVSKFMGKALIPSAPAARPITTAATKLGVKRFGKAAGMPGGAEAQGDLRNPSVFVNVERNVARLEDENFVLKSELQQVRSWTEKMDFVRNQRQGGPELIKCTWLANVWFWASLAGAAAGTIVYSMTTAIVAAPACPQVSCNRGWQMCWRRARRALAENPAAASVGEQEPAQSLQLPSVPAVSQELSAATDSSLDLARVPWFDVLVPPPSLIRVPPPRCVATAAESSSIELLDSYEVATARLLDEIAATDTGDCIDLGLYLLEGGRSSEALLAALQEAGTSRGVQVRFQLDVSYVSMISRIVEKTDTLVDRVAQLADEQPEWCSCVWGNKPDHGKYACFQRQLPRQDSAILGGMNLGDRFSSWDDYAVFLPPPYAGKLRESLLAVPATSDATGSLGAPPSRLKLGAATWDVGAISSARTIAVISPVVALVTTLTVATSTAAVVIIPAAGVAQQPDFVGGMLTWVFGLGATAAYLGTAFATAANGGSFDVGYEMAMFVRSLVFDRSWLGDRLAPFRPLYSTTPCDINRSTGDGSSSSSAGGGRSGGGDSSGGALESDTLRDRRLLPMPTLPAADRTIEVVCNRRMQQRYEVEPTFRALFSDTRFTYYRITMAYLGHRWGVELLERALLRGARVDLLLPARANVYASENLKAAQTLVDADWPTLRLFLHPEMVHAKATLAWSPGAGESEPSASEGPGPNAIAFLGSANLVRGSLNLPVHCGLLPFDELNVLVQDPTFCATLNSSMHALFAQARQVRRGEALIASSEWYEEARAQREELLQ